MAKIYIIDWIDSASENGWVASNDLGIANIAKCQSVGYLVKETKEHITLAQNRSKDESHYPFGELISIPCVAITKKRQIGKSGI